MSCKKTDFVNFSLTVVFPEPRMEPDAQECMSAFSALCSFHWGESEGKKNQLVFLTRFTCIRMLKLYNTHQYRNRKPQKGKENCQRNSSDQSEWMSDE